MAVQNTSNYSDRQIEILAGALVSQPQDLPTPEQKLEFANAFSAPKPEAPNESSLLSLDVVRMGKQDISPTSRIQFLHDIQALSNERFERSIDSGKSSMSDSEYLTALRKVRPFADDCTATIIDNILAYYRVC